MTLDSYISLLSKLVSRGYVFRTFDASAVIKNFDCILRHDIDFDVGKALRMAKAEAQNSWFSTYFFLIRSKSYNVLDPEIRRMIEEISSLGHVISLHFDTSIYDDFETGLFEELKLFEKIFGVTPTVISLHRPNEFFLHSS